MAQEILIKRTIWVAKCSGCGDRSEITENPPKEKFCFRCKQWVPYVEESYTGPTLNPKDHIWP